MCILEGGEGRGGGGGGEERRGEEGKGEEGREEERTGEKYVEVKSEVSVIIREKRWTVKRLQEKKDRKRQNK